VTKRFTKGWVKAWRDSLDEDLPDNVWLWGIWNWLLLSAIWKPTKILWKGKQREILPGTVVMGLGELANKWGCSKNTIKRWLKYLEETGRISVESCTRGTLVSVLQWGVYQAQDENTERELHENCTQAAHELHFSKEYKKEEYKKKEERETPRILPEEIKQCIEEWGKTLSHHKIQKDPRFDESSIASLIIRNGCEKTKLALLGARYEEGSPTYDPSKHVSILRLFKSDIFETFVNLGAQNQPRVRQFHEVEGEVLC